jgi:hypothetical protein
MTQVSLSTSTNFDGDSNALIEDQGSELTISLNLDEAAPAGGLRVFIDSDVEQIINRLDLPTFAFNPVTENINPATIATDFDNSGVALTIDEGATSASFTIPIFDNPEPDTFLPETFDGLVEATLSVITASEVSAENADNITDIGEYTVDSSAASSVVIFADDASQLSGDTPEEPETPVDETPTEGEEETPETPVDETPTEGEGETPEAPTGELPVVSFETTPDTFSEEAENNLVEWKWTVTGDFPEEGILVNLDTSGGNPDVPFDFTNQFAAEPPAEFINSTIVDSDNDTGRINILLTEPEASFKLYFINDILEEGAQPFDFQLAEGEGYTVDPDQNGTIFTITDDNGGPGVGPTIGISASATDLAEGDPLTVTFTVDGEIPEEGIQVLVESPVFGALGQFDLADLSNLELTGIDGLPEVGDAGGGSFFVTITEPTATITTSVFDDILAEEATELPFTIANGELYEVDPDAASITLNLADETAPSGPVVGLTVDKTDIIEGETITLTFNVEGDIPEGGVTVLVNDAESAGSQLRSLTEFDVSNIETTGIAEFPEPADGDSGFFVNITEPTATITLPLLDDGADEDEAAESFTFEVIDGEGYDVDPDAGSITLNIADVGDTPGESDPTTEEPTEPGETPTGDAPVVNFSTDVTTLTESENSLVTFNFSVDGEIPEGGLPIALNIENSSDPTWFFDLNNAARPSVNPDTGSFDSVTILGREITGIDAGRAIGSLASPDFNVLEFTITENEASFQIEIFDDVFAEENESISFSVTDGEGYTSASSDPIVLTLQDSPEGIIDATSPQVSLSLDQSTIAEGETLTVNLSVDGEIPEGGLTVFVNGSAAGALGEFAVSELETTGIEGQPGPNADAGGFVVTLVENEASITLPVFKDGLGEGVEEYTFTVADGELYDPNPEASSASLTIEETPPVISLGVVGGTFVENELVTPNLVESTEEGTPILSLVLQSDAPVPEEGLVVDVNTDLVDITQFVNEAQFSPTTFGGQVIGAIYDDEGVATGLRVRMDSANTVVNFQSGVGFEAEGPQDVTFSVEEGEGYTSDGESASITVYDTLDQVPEVTATPEIGISLEEAQESPLSEGRGAITLNFAVDGEIPPEGVIAYVATGEFGGLGDFDLLNAGVMGGPFPAPDGQVGGFFFKITEPEASITIQAAEDEVDEGIETVNLALQPLPGYTIAEGASDVSIQLRDGRGSEIQVGIESEPEILIESEGTVANFTLNLSSAPPESGVTVALNSENLAEFDAEGLEITGGEVVSIGDDGTVEILVTEQTATLSVPVSSDGETEGGETATFTPAEPGEDAGYQISSTDPEANETSFDIYDTVNDSPVIVESEESDDTIDTSIPIAINGDRSTALVRGEIDFDFGDNRDVDQTEDVDMYSVELQTGDRLTLDLDSIPFENSEGFVLRGGGDLRIFNEAGEELVYNAEGSAPDELLASGRDAYIDFTAETAGTYYIGISQTFNEDYDPNVKGSGDGAILSPQFGIGAGEYELNVDLNPGEPTFEQYEEFDGETNPDAPTVSFTAVPGTYQGDDVLSSQIIESLGAEDGQAALLNFTFNVDGEIPESGIEVVVTSDTDFSGFLDDLTGTPRTAVGGSILGAVYNEDGSVAGFRALLTAANASFPFPVLERTEDDPDMPESIEFSLANGADYLVSSEVNTSNVTFYDTLEQIQSGSDLPQVGVTIDQTELIESEGTEVNIGFNVDGDIPEGGLLAYLDSETRGSLGEFDVFNAEVTGGAFPSANGDASGFYFLIQENTANISLSVFDETTNELIPEEDALEGIEEFNFSLVESDAYTIDSSAAGFNFTIADNPDSVAIEQPEEPEEEAELPEVPTDNDGRETNNDTIADAVALGLNAASDNLSITIDGEIAARFRGTENSVDNTEDVDIYSFDLQEGQTITIDVDANGVGDAGLESILDSNLRIFDGEGTELVLNEEGAAPNEVFQAEGDPYLEFTAPETGTYYAGISALGNDFYDPNVAASGSGWTFGERFGADVYQVNFSLGSQVVEQPTEPPVIDGGDLNPAFGTVDADVIEVTESNQLIFAGESDDIIDLTESNGDNRVYGDNGDDILILGENNRILAGDGDDRIFVTSGGNNTISGDEGADQFWIANAEIPEASNTFTDFTAGEDVIGVAGLGIGYSDLSITAVEGDALISANDSDLAILSGVAAESLSESDFAFG